MRRADVPGQLKDLVLGALEARYISESCQDAIKTGNHYQSLALGDSTTEGFRSGRAEFLDRIDFRGKKVLDLGSNLGEMSRGARARGARLVDGFEYDPYFVEIADLVNVYNGTSRVSFYRRDITDPSIYGERYDVVLVLSVFIYAGKVIDRLAEITDIIVLETHKLRGNLEETYIEPISKHFPAYEVLGETEWGTIHDPGERRAVAVFAKDEELLREVLLDAPLPSLPEPKKDPGSGRRKTFSAEIDMRRTRLHQGFFERFPAETGAEVLAAVAERPFDLDALLAGDDARRAYNGWTYWFAFLRGYLEYRADGTVELDNPYLLYLRRFFGPRASDPSFSRALEDDAAALKAVARRFRDLAHYEGLASETASDYVPAPIRLILSDPPRAYQHTLITSSGEELSPRQLDGWHRLFAARLFGAERLASEIVRADARLGEVLAVIEHFSYDGDVVKLSGWCLSPDVPLHNAQLTANGMRVANAELHRREDVAAWFPQLPHAHRSGFGFEARRDGDPGEPADFVVTVMEEWLPVARTEIRYLPEMLTDDRLPPAALTRRLLGVDDPTTAAARAARFLQPVLASLRRQLDLDSVGSVLEWGVDTGLLQPLLSRELAGAAITGLGFDSEAIDWASAELPGEFRLADRGGGADLPGEGFDVVIGCSTLPQLGPEEQTAWLAELHRMTRPGGYVALTVQGELLRRFLPPEASDAIVREGIGQWPAGGGWQPRGRTVQTREHTIRSCSEWFEVVEYAEGAANDSEDLLLLRRAGTAAD